MLVAGGVIWLAWQTAQSQKRGALVEAQMMELRRELQSVATRFNEQLKIWKAKNAS